MLIQRPGQTEHGDQNREISENQIHIDRKDQSDIVPEEFEKVTEGARMLVRLFNAFSVTVAAEDLVE